MTVTAHAQIKEQERERKSYTDRSALNKDPPIMKALSFCCSSNSGWKSLQYAVPIEKKNHDMYFICHISVAYPRPH